MKKVFGMRILQKGPHTVTRCVTQRHHETENIRIHLGVSARNKRLFNPFCNFFLPGARHWDEAIAGTRRYPARNHPVITLQMGIAIIVVSVAANVHAA